MDLFLRMQNVLYEIRCPNFIGSKILLQNTAIPVLSNHSKINQAKILMTNDSLMKVESIAECSLGAFCNTFDLRQAIIGLETQFWSFEWSLKTGFTVPDLFQNDNYLLYAESSGSVGSVKTAD